MMLEVDETVTMMIDFQGHPRSGSRSGDDLSPLSGLFLCVLTVAMARFPSDCIVIPYVVPVLWMASFIYIMALWCIMCILLK